MLEALIAGNTDPAAMADLARYRLRAKIPQLTEALAGRFTAHHAFLTRMHLELIDRHTEVIDQLTQRIEVMMQPFQHFRDLICTIPGIGDKTADVIVAETGADMTRFPTAAHLASWAGTTPGNNESAGKVKSSRTRPGNPYLQGALGAAALSISHTRGTYLAAKYRRIATRRGAPGKRRRPARHPHRHLAHGHHRHRIHRPRSRLLHPTQPRQSPRHSRPTTRSHGLPRHPRPRLLSELLTPASQLTNIFASGWTPRSLISIRPPTASTAPRAPWPICDRAHLAPV